MTEKTIYIFRHGQTDYNAEKRVMGQLDIQLNKTGINQANELADKMSNNSIQAIYSSPLSRALETAKIVSEKTGAEIITDNALMERNNGKLQGHIVHATDNPAEYQTDYNQTELFWPLEQIKDTNWHPEGGESRTECFKRAQKAFMNILKNTPYNTIAISTHGGPMTGILHLIDNSDKSIGNCECVKLTFDGKTLNKSI